MPPSMPYQGSLAIMASAHHLRLNMTAIPHSSTASNHCLFIVHLGYRDIFSPCPKTAFSTLMLSFSPEMRVSSYWRIYISSKYRVENYSDRAGNGLSVLLSNHTGLASFSESSDSMSILWNIRVSPMRSLKMPDSSLVNSVTSNAGCSDKLPNLFVRTCAFCLNVISSAQHSASRSHAQACRGVACDLSLLYSNGDCVKQPGTLN